jgi:hypothetical protein
MLMGFNIFLNIIFEGYFLLHVFIKIASLKDNNCTLSHTLLREF